MGMGPSKGVILFLLFALMSCQPTVVEKQVLIQCWDGSVAESVENCPHREVYKEVIPSILVPEATSVPQVAPSQTPPPTVTTVQKSIMQQLLENVPDNYWFSDEKYGAIVSGSKRSTGEYNQWLEYYIAISYWDLNNKNEKGEYILYLQAGRPIPDVWWQEHITGTEQRGGGLDQKYHTAFFQLNLSRNRELDEKKIPKELNKYYYEAKEGQLTRVIESFYRKSPVEWMDEYADEVPTRMDTKPIEMPFSSGMAQASMTIEYAHKEKPDHSVVFYIHPAYKIPLIIDEKKGGELVQRTSYFFDTMYTKEGKLRVPITEEIVTLPKDYIIVTPKEYQEFLDDLEGQY